jgi:hypothetical protein
MKLQYTVAVEDVEGTRPYTFATVWQKSEPLQSSNEDCNVGGETRPSRPNTELEQHITNGYPLANNELPFQPQLVAYHMARGRLSITGYVAVRLQ